MKQTALITGASRGIGRAVARALAEAGCRVAVHYHTHEREACALVDMLHAAGHEAMAVQADVADSRDVARMVRQVGEKWKHIDILINNAGIALQKLLSETSDEEWARVFGVNVDGAFYCARAVLPGMTGHRHGRIVNVASVWGVAGASCEAAYSASKAALIGLTKALAKEVGPSLVTVNCVAPGVIDTDMNAALTADVLSALADETPLGRLGHAEEVARAVLYFCSEDAAFVTGQVLCVSGGFAG